MTLVNDEKWSMRVVRVVRVHMILTSFWMVKCHRLEKERKKNDQLQRQYGVGATRRGTNPIGV